MPTCTARRRLHAPSHGLRVFVGFGLLAFTNALLPAIVFAASYLIIPFPAPIVLLIQAAPAALVKLSLPRFLSKIPPPLRPLLLAIAWFTAAIVTAATPPNVPPLVRILMSVLASSSAAAADVCFMTTIRPPRYHSALAGWAVGSSLGNAAAAIMPFYLTIHLGRFLRSSVDYVNYLILIFLLAYFVVLPWNLAAPADPTVLGDKPAVLSVNNLGPPLPRQPANCTMLQRVRHGFIKPLIGPYILPLALASMLQSAMIPGVGRAQKLTPAFTSFTAFKAAHGLALHLGSLVTRTSILFVRIHKHGFLFAAMVVSVLASLAGAATLTFSDICTLILPLVTGLAGGAIYINIFGKAMEHLSTESLAEFEWSLACISAAETIGILIGSLYGSFIEAQLCSQPFALGRWCTSPR
ncbi:hypothetical protein CDD82_6926 [Ophiocordyceps australis]|uniref:Protein BTN n=1 Tax=Ophiocordyceps australis TaxID=1399860 RepID=A0A2C5YTY1_9HYPO|nr:hypothetical protein CDD82_6926 [Ophiocordyceps australis]